MASGKPVVEVINALPPGSSAATRDVRVGGSTPAESWEVFDFNDTTDEYMDFLCRLSEDYASGGLTFTLPWSSTATTGVCRWGIAIRRVQDDAEDVDTSETYDFNEVDDTTASAAGELSYPTITFTDGADMNSWAAGELAMVRVYRNADHGNDTLSGDAELWGIFGKET